jgi:2-hydroxychromene-2-carboxylate isomerase
LVGVLGLKYRQVSLASPLCNHCSMTIELIEHTDPGCPWAYSASPALAVLQWRYGDQLSWRMVTIGLTERHEQYVERGYTPARSAKGQRRFRRFGMPFAPQLKERPAATARMCRAIHAVRRQDPEREREAFRALQFAQFTTDLVMDVDDSLRAALGRVDGLDVEAVVAALDSAEVSAAYEADRAEARTAEGTPTHAQGKHATSDGPVRYTAPSLIFRSGSRQLEAGGFQPLEAYDVVLANLDPGLSRRPVGEDAAEVLAAFDYALTTAEVAAIMTPDLHVPDLEATEAALIDAVADGRARREQLGDDALWAVA